MFVPLVRSEGVSGEHCLSLFLNLGTLEASRLQKGLGLSRAGLNDGRVNFVTDSVIINMATSPSKYNFLSESSCPNEPLGGV